MNNATVVDAMVGALTDPFDEVHMAITAENVAAKWGVSREDQDKFALLSQQRATDAIKHCKFKEQILPIEVKTKAGSTFVDTDEQPRGDTTLDALAKLKPVFDKNGTVTVGNASTLNEGRRFYANRAAGGLCSGRRRAEIYGHRTRSRSQEGARENRTHSQRPGRDRRE
jgi:acetyl-CoA C-acetyltransferase